MWRAAAGLLAIALVLTGCTRYEPSGEMTRAFRTETEAGSGTDGEEIVLSSYPQRTPVKVKGIYVSAFVAGTEEMMDRIIEQIDETELNSVVIDFKDDQGRITCQVDTPFINEISACRTYLSLDIENVSV